jgi:hypothetical protein
MRKHRSRENIRREPPEKRIQRLIELLSHPRGAKQIRATFERGSCRTKEVKGKGREGKGREGDVPPTVPDGLERTLSMRLGRLMSAAERAGSESQNLISSGSQRRSGCHPATTSCAEEKEYEKGIKYGFHGRASLNRHEPSRCHDVCTCAIAQSIFGVRTAHSLPRAVRREKVRPPGDGEVTPGLGLRRSHVIKEIARSVGSPSARTEGVVAAFERSSDNLFAQGA